MDGLSEQDKIEEPGRTMADSPRKRSGRRPFVILGLVLLSLMVGGFIYWLQARNFETTSDAEIDGAIHRIAPRIAGQVAAVLIHDNQHVTKGQILVRLDPGIEKVALARAEAEQAQARAELGNREADVAQAKANVEVARANLYKAQRDAARYDKVNPQAVTSSNRDAATAELHAATARLDVARRQVSGAQASVVAAQAALKAAGVAVANAKLQLSYTEIRSPVSGYVAQRTVRSGNVVAPGTALMAVVGDRVWVTANFKETQLAEIHPGQKVTVYVDAVPGVGFHARVASIQHGTGSVFSLLPAENATGNYVKVVQRVPVRIEFDDKRTHDYLLAPGMSVEPYVRIRGK